MAVSSEPQMVGGEEKGYERSPGKLKGGYFKKGLSASKYGLLFHSVCINVTI